MQDNISYVTPKVTARDWEADSCTIKSSQTVAHTARYKAIDIAKSVCFIASKFRHG